MDATERKLMKKAHKLAKFARKHGLEYAHVGVMAPDKHCSRWFTDVTANREKGEHISLNGFIEDGEL